MLTCGNAEPAYLLQRHRRSMIPNVGTETTNEYFKLSELLDMCICNAYYQSSRTVAITAERRA